MNWNRITIDGRAYIIEASAATEIRARKLARQMNCKLRRVPGRVPHRDWLILRPTGAFGLPGEKATDSRLQASEAEGATQ